MIDTCFGKDLQVGYKHAISNFETKWRELFDTFGVSITNKAHITMKHITQKIERTGTSLYNGNEEVVEAAHKRFDEFWKRYKICQVDRESHGSNLFNCLIDVNVNNL